MSRLYDTDLSDAAWALVAPHLPAAEPGGRPRTTSLRAVVDAILHLLRSGCQRRPPPREHPPRGAARRWWAAGAPAGLDRTAGRPAARASRDRRPAAGRGHRAPSSGTAADLAAAPPHARPPRAGTTLLGYPLIGTDAGY